MTTEKLYYHQPPVHTFTARVLACRQAKDGWAVTLDRTAFYPEGGGQPADRGSLGGVPVLDTQEAGGVVTHFTGGPLPVGETVEGRVDMARRLDFTQQHSGEHILSGFLFSMFGATNKGFHIGHECLTMDTSVPIPRAGMEEAEWLANQVVWQDVETQSAWYEKDQLAGLTYRSKKELEGPVRLVTIPGADCCACCGTHVQRTGQVGQIKIVDWLKYKEGTRIVLLCGGRALQYAERQRAQSALIGAALSAKQGTLAQAVQRQKQELEQANFRLIGLENQLFEAWAAGVRPGESPLVCREGLGPDALRRLTAALARRTGGVCAAASPAGDGRLQYAIAQSAAGADLRPLCQRLNAALNGRGGGKPGFVQGSVAAAPDQLRAFWAGQSFD